MTEDETDLSGGEAVFFWGLLAVCAALGPVVLGHVRGTSSAVDRAAEHLPLDERTRARVAGTTHLSWIAVTAAAVAVLAGQQDLPAVFAPAVLVLLVAGLLDVSVLLTGRPQWSVLERHRVASRR